MNKFRQPAYLRLLIITGVWLIFILFQARFIVASRVAVALAKSHVLLDTGSQPHLLVDPAELSLPEKESFLFISAVRLVPSETAQWDCPPYDCVQVTYFDQAVGVTVNQIINMQTDQIIHEGEEAFGRPAGSPAIMSQALEIAASDPQVAAVLGDISQPDPVMVPMSGWLSDDDCRDEWCVDLTFHSPAGDGRVFHVFVNIQQQKVARTFYTRGRDEIAVTLPENQRGLFSNGCHEQYGWQLCWEMTAHDGINFFEASFEGDPVFNSAKITQIEAWYPSWPGGYRDEIGFNATVRPFGDTEIIDLDDGFEIRQLFTEFTRWPNCICCYRYEQIVRVFADGSFEFKFVSHGPGCDDLSVYRPFWRIDPAGEHDIFSWQQTAWVEELNETEFHPFVDRLSPDGYQLATQGENQLYQWVMERSDPLGLDEARVFLLQKNENEGEGPLLPGPGDTFQPPRQWLNNDPLAGEDIVIWFVPLLNTKKGDPWWCMPDPVPGINQCEAILRADPIPSLVQPTEAELALIPTPSDTPTPRPTQTPAPSPSPRPISGQTAAEIILNSGCGACHQIGELGEAGKVGPDLSNIGHVAGGRIPAVEAETYLKQSILAPDDYLAPDCPNGPCLAHVMPADYGSRLTPEQLDTLVMYLLGLIEPTPTPLTIIGEAVPQATAVGKAGTLAKSAAQQSSPAADQWIALQFVLLGTVFILTVFLIRQRPQSDK